uniref:Uncharacterized protein n=1 Tax=viral metagenome TaxID=1070528 RepID=A0A6C0BPC5_9ZZZZ
MKFRYCLIEVPAEFSGNDETTVQVFREKSPGQYDYVMDFSRLVRICFTEGWPIESRDWFECPEELESFGKENHE